jgi:hypothetical protein
MAFKVQNLQVILRANPSLAVILKMMRLGL